VWLARTDRDGAILWQKTLDGPGFARDPAVAVDRDGRVFVVAVSMCLGEGRDLWLVGLRADGTIDWQVGVGALGNADVTSIAAGPDGRAYVAAGRRYDDPYADYVWLAAIEPGGVVAWQRDLVGSGQNTARVEVADDDGLLLVGQVRDPSFTHDAAWVVRMSLSGELLWQRGYCDGDAGDLGGGAIATADGYLVVGQGKLWSSYADHLWFGWLDHDGNVLQARFLETGGCRGMPDFVLREGEVILVGRDDHGALVGRIGTDSLSPDGCTLLRATPLVSGVVDVEVRDGIAIPYSTDGTAMDSAVAFHAADVCMETACPE
jgi:hypothetical protein